MDFVWTAGFCCLAWFSGALFGVWSSGRRSKQTERRRRSSYFEQERDRWRPARVLIRRLLSIGVAVVSLLLVLAIAYILSVPRPKHEGGLRGRVAAELHLTPLGSVRTRAVGLA